MAEETKRALFDFQEIREVDDFRGVYEDIKPFISGFMTLWGMMRERGLGVKDALVAIEYASNRAKAEMELQDLINKVSDMETQANLLENEVFASRLQMITHNRPPPSSMKAAINRIIALANQPKANEPTADNHCFEDYNTTNKD